MTHSGHMRMQIPEGSQCYAYFEALCILAYKYAPMHSYLNSCNKLNHELLFLSVLKHS